jgi:hypothetical protein
MARRVGGVAIVDTPEITYLGPIQPIAVQIKGLGCICAELSHNVATPPRRRLARNGDLAGKTMIRQVAAELSVLVSDATLLTDATKIILKWFQRDTSCSRLVGSRSLYVQVN